jgi:inosine-uridine nucleoside N-ribohydrolase
LLGIFFLASLLLLEPAAAGSKPIQGARPLVITTDCGADIDDQWAIAHASLARELKLLAIIGNFAPKPHNLASAQTTTCAQRVLQAIGRGPGIGLYRGADRSLANRAFPVRNAGVRAIIRLAKNHSPQNRLIVLGLGPVTDIASALLIEPLLADRIEVVALAFDKYPEGGDGWNVRNDVRAWQILLDSQTPITAASGTVALKYLNLTRGETKAVMRGLGRPGKYLANLHAAWLARYGKEFAPETGGKDHWPVWDEALIAVLLGLSQDQRRARPRLNPDATFAFPNRTSRASFKWVVSIDRKRLFGHLRRQLQRSQSSLSQSLCLCSKNVSYRISTK